MFGNEGSPLISVMGTKVPGNEGSWERKFQGTKVPWYESSSYHTYSTIHVVDFAVPVGNN